MSINLVIPMAGKGSRYSSEGFSLPKPLVEFYGKPLFWWAVESVSRKVDICTLVFVILDIHDKAYNISNAIKKYYPYAVFVRLRNVTKGAAESCFFGLDHIDNFNPIGFLDCDLIIDLPHLQDDLAELSNCKTDASLVTFKSKNSAYSYVVYDINNNITGTIEKKPLSEDAIAGLYLFSNKSLFTNAYASYLNECQYEELYMSGIYDLLIKNGSKISIIKISKHISLGTPNELFLAKSRNELPYWFGNEH